jgi:hypothetical protein
MAGEAILAPIKFPSLSDQCLICLFLFCLLSRRKKKTERFLHASARGGISRRRIIREQRRRRPRIINGTGTVTAPQASMQSPGKGNKAAASPTLLFNSHGSAGLNFPARHSAPHLSSLCTTYAVVSGAATAVKTRPLSSQRGGGVVKIEHACAREVGRLGWPGSEN